jgi:hypothetical protein
MHGPILQGARGLAAPLGHDVLKVVFCYFTRELCEGCAHDIPMFACTGHHYWNGQYQASSDVCLN